MSVLKTEGIIVHTLKFKDTDQIATVFTPQEGLLKFLIKRAYTSKHGKGSHSALLTRAEIVYSKGKADLHLCQEMSPLNAHPHLRDNLPLLEASFDLLKSIRASQVPNRPAQPLYLLLQMTLERLHHLPDPWTAPLSMRLKILRDEGVFHPSSNCALCHTPLATHYLFQGESYCRAHSPPLATEFSQEEYTLLTHLAQAHSWGDLSVSLPLYFAPKIIDIFNDHFQ